MAKVRFRWAMMLGLWLLAGPAAADLGFPDYVKFPPQIVVDPDQKLVAETLAEAEFESTAAGAPNLVRRGRHFTRWYVYRPAAGEPKPGYDNGTEERIWKAIEAPLLRAGWETIYLEDNKSSAVLRYLREGRESWLRMRMDGPQAAVNFTVIEMGGSANAALVHPAPAAKPEVIREGAAIPYLTPYPGSKLIGGGRGDGPLDVTIAFPSDMEAPVAGRSTLIRTYDGPSTLSSLQFTSENREALTKAGWTILYPSASSTANGLIIARYTKEGRDIWARLTYEYGAQISYTVTDPGGEDWSSALERECRLVLRGVRFEFNKATITPDSDAILTRAAAILKQKTGFAVEVQGHTDNVGTADYNRTLSQARAASVQLWLGTHGVEPSRLSAKGFGKTQPVADNGSDFGRAQNRRVELVRTTCRKT